MLREQSYSDQILSIDQLATKRDQALNEIRQAYERVQGHTEISSAYAKGLKGSEECEAAPGYDISRH